MKVIFFLKKIIYRLTSKTLSFLGYKLIKKEKNFSINIEKFRNRTSNYSVENFIHFIFENKNLSKSQIFQDLFVDFILRRKLNGFYCEVGAADGFNLSNTFFLEKERKWKGILCEPSHHWRKQLNHNRKENILVFDAISNKKETITFYENDNKFLSSLEKNKNYSKSYSVNTTTLNDIFLKFNVKEIDYLSIDTEGNELKVLEGLDLKKYRPKIITIEHNYENERLIYKILSQQNYDLIYPYLSRFDSFFVCQKFLEDK